MIIEYKNDNLLLISVKPQYAKKILEGKKTIELRKSAPQRINKDTLMLIYVTSPINELWGVCKIKNIIKDNPKKLWERVGVQTGITEEEFNSYYKKYDNAFGIEVEEIKNLSKHSISLSSLRKLINGFIPPQTYGYINKNEIDGNLLNQILCI